MNKREHPDIEIRNKALLLKNPDVRKDVFVRDCCFLCENIFFAEGKGLDINKDILNILKKAQPGKRGINNYAIFGLRKNNRADGLTGHYLEIKGNLAEQLIKILRVKATNLEKPFGKYVQCQGKCQ